VIDPMCEWCEKTLAAASFRHGYQGSYALCERCFAAAVEAFLPSR
jgi:hypothetical protein